MDKDKFEKLLEARKIADQELENVSASEQLVDELTVQFDERLAEARRQNDFLQEEIETTREQGRSERRRLTEQIEELEETSGRAKEVGRQQVSEDLQAQIRFQLEESERAKQQVEQELVTTQAKWLIERNSLKAQIASMEGSVLEAMERSNNPTRLALAVREQVDARISHAKQDWQLEWEGERRRLNKEIERLKKAGDLDAKKNAAKRALLQKLGKLPPVAPGAAAPRTADEWQREFEGAQVQWQIERDELSLKLERSEGQSQDGRDGIRSEIFQEIRGQYQPQLVEFERERKRLNEELETVSIHLEEDRKRLTARIEELERAIPEAQEAVRLQVTAELKADFEGNIEEMHRLRARNERRAQDAVEELEVSLRRSRKLNAQLEEQLAEAKEIAVRAQRDAR